jgi:hypothetical protein
MSSQPQQQSPLNNLLSPSADIKFGRTMSMSEGAGGGPRLDIASSLALLNQINNQHHQSTLLHGQSSNGNVTRPNNVLNGTGGGLQLPIAQLESAISSMHQQQQLESQLHLRSQSFSGTAPPFFRSNMNTMFNPFKAAVTSDAEHIQIKVRLCQCASGTHL